MATELASQDAVIMDYLRSSKPLEDCMKVLFEFFDESPVKNLIIHSLDYPHFRLGLLLRHIVYTKHHQTFIMIDDDFNNKGNENDRVIDVLFASCPMPPIVSLSRFLIQGRKSKNLFKFTFLNSIDFIFMTTEIFLVQKSIERYQNIFWVDFDVSLRETFEESKGKLHEILNKNYGKHIICTKMSQSQMFEHGLLGVSLFPRYTQFITQEEKYPRQGLFSNQRK